VIYIYAHRGLHVDERENTLAAFSAARQLGVDGVEFDVRRTVDGALVVHHDPACGSLVVSETRQRELPDYLPTLDAALAACEGMMVNVEIKNSRDRTESTYDDSGQFARQVVQVLHEIKWSDRVIISSFDQATCAAVRSIDSAMPVGWLLGNAGPADALTQAHILEFTAVHPHFKLLNAAWMTRAHELGLDVNTWTVNSRRDITAMVNLGVNCIISDNPARALALTKRTPPDGGRPAMQ
jgi:glycerophosphoryl diester phosphodiesterase